MTSWVALAVSGIDFYLEAISPMRAEAQSSYIAMENKKTGKQLVGPLFRD